MSFTVLLLTTIFLPGLWGWLIGACAGRFWPVSVAPQRPAVPAPAQRPPDYDI